MKVERAKPTILAVSDSIGETAEIVIKAAIIQFESSDVVIRKVPYVTDIQYAQEVVDLAKDIGNCVIICTIILPEVREFLLKQAKENCIPIVDLMGPMMEVISKIVDLKPQLEPGLVHKTDADYFKKMEAIEFAVQYDDGKDPRGLYRADVVLIGVSRTSKTPLALYLAHQRLKVANLPLVPEVVPPKELFQLPKNKIIGLTITPDKLYEIRYERLKSLGLGTNAIYVNRERIQTEIEYANKIMENLDCPRIDVSNKAVEEIATNILDIIKKGDLSMTKKYVYSFNEGNASMRSLLGGKGANLAEMVKIGLPVPMGFTVTTEACLKDYDEGEKIPQEILTQVEEALAQLEQTMGKKLGSNENPLLVSVRSGAVISMPGMMDTILNLGLNDDTVIALAKATDNERFAYDSYRRFIQMFASVVKEIDLAKFEDILHAHKEENNIVEDSDVDAQGWKDIVAAYKELYKKELGEEFPQDPKEQLLSAVEAVFKSWNNQRAKVYRRLNKIPDDLGTAVNVQTMVFGNMGDDCATGVAFTRNPSTGEKGVFGEFLVNAQGEDVVAGIRTPKALAELEEVMPEAYQEFLKVCKTLESHYKDMQDIEFTIENRKLYILQTRSGKRTAQAAIKIAVDLVKEGLISKEEALLMVPAGQLETLLHRAIDPNAKVEAIAKGLPASPGAAFGKVVFDPDEAEVLGNEGEKVMLVRTETTPDDIHGMVAAEGILTSRGGMTSHAAVVARGMGKPCICGCDAIKIDYEKAEFRVGDIVVKKGDMITIDGASGQVMLGEVPTIDPELSDEFNLILEWADEVRTIKVRTNADTPKDATLAKEFGAEGIGLCRTEHMFMSQERLPIVQRMILSETKEEREAALAELLPIQQKDFEEIFAVMEGLPVTVRLLDPPLHEFLPNAEELITEIYELRAKGNSKELEEKQVMLQKVRALSELNPMLGLRGCRLGLLYPEIYIMQVKAIIQAACKLVKEGIKVIPEIEIPLVGHELELKELREVAFETAEEIIKAEGIELEYLIGTMIELPRACLTADKIVNHADFFSFGTNDLTQTTFGYSRDDAEGKILPLYLEKRILSDSPFIVLDRDGVGSLMKTAVELGRKVKPDLLVGICGEHGGEPSSVEFCHMIGLDFVSCSPYRVPIARLAAAQAAIRHKVN